MTEPSNTPNTLPSPTFTPEQYSAARIMAIFAHPDDEAFTCGGALAAYAEAGAEVTLLCATRGEAGKITDPTMTIDDLGQQREAELREACRVLGISEPIFLDYHDSGRFERTRTDDPQALMNVKVFDIENRLMPHIEQHRPHIVITFDPHGGYGHIDHLKIQRAASAAYFSAGNLPYGGPQRLYYTGIPVTEAQQMNMMDPAHALDPVRYGISEATVAVKLNISRWAEQKKAALAAHGTQMGPSSALGRLDPAVRADFERRTLSQEWFSLGGTRTALSQFPLNDLLDGVNLSR